MAVQKQPVVEALRKASKSLQFTSETEAGFEPFLWEGGDKLTKQRLLELARAEKGTAVAEDTLGRFFHAVPPEDKAKFDKLAEALRSSCPGSRSTGSATSPRRTSTSSARRRTGSWPVSRPRLLRRKLV